MAKHRRERGKMENYGPELTPEIREKLLKEIAEFDEKSTLEKLNREAVGKKEAPGYAVWRVIQDGGRGNKDRQGDKYGSESDPDILSEEDAIDLRKPPIDAETEKTKKNIDMILSFRELQVWRLVMRRGLSYKQAASLLHVSEGTVKTYLQRAKEKVEGLNDAG